MTRKGCFFAVLTAAVAISGAAIVPAATQDKPVAKPASTDSQTATKKPVEKKAAAKKQDPKKQDSKKQDSKKAALPKKDVKKDSAEAAKALPSRPANANASPAKPSSAKLASKKAATKKEAAKAAHSGAVPLPKMRPADGIPVAVAAFPNPIGAPPSGVLSAETRPQAFAPAFAPALASVNPQQQIPVVLAPGEAPSSENLAAVTKAIDLARRGRGNEATAIANAVTDPVAAKLIEWMVLRSETGDFDFQRYAGFAAANPGWPNITQFRRKAEAALWQNGVNDTVVRRYFATTKPLTSKGKLALARALIAQGDRATAQSLVRDTWRTDALTDRHGSADTRRIRSIADGWRPQGAHGPPHLCGRHRGCTSCGTETRRFPGRDRQSRRSGDRQVIQGQGAARRRASGGAKRYGLSVQPCTMAAAQ